MCSQLTFKSKLRINEIQMFQWRCFFFCHIHSQEEYSQFLQISPIHSQWPTKSSGLHLVLMSRKAIHLRSCVANYTGNWGIRENQYESLGNWGKNIFGPLSFSLPNWGSTILLGANQFPRPQGKRGKMRENCFTWFPLSQIGKRERFWYHGQWSILGHSDIQWTALLTRAWRHWSRACVDLQGYCSTDS